MKKINLMLIIILILMCTISAAGEEVHLTSKTSEFKGYVVSYRW